MSEEKPIKICLTCGREVDKLYERGYCEECMADAENWANSEKEQIND